MNRLEVLAPEGVPEVVPGDDLVALVEAATDLRDGDVLVVTSKVVSKAEGRVRPGGREEALAAETARVVARRGPTSIVRTHHGLTLAAAGIDASNVASGQIVLLPEDPDLSARRLRERLAANVGVVVTDTAGRPWREGQTDIAVGAAGIRVSEDFAGREDAHGNPLAVTRPAVADEIAGAAELAQGKLGGRPFAVLRGRSDLVLPAGEHGDGARSLVRVEGADMFGYGAREAVVRALVGDPADQVVFGAPADADDLARALVEALGPLELTVEPDLVRLRLDPALDPAGTAVRALCFAHGWSSEDPLPDRPGAVTVLARPAGP